MGKTAKTMKRLPNRPICETSLRWVVNYRAGQQVARTGASRSERGRIMKRVFLADDHTQESWKWVQRQSQVIDRQGWHSWILFDGAATEGFSGKQ